MMTPVEVDELLSLVEKAGEAILSKYRIQNEITFKEDRSPLTEADQLSHSILSDGLNRVAPGVPILSEEGETVPYAVRSAWDAYFLIDPLDGTKGFIKRSDEFSINIALVEGGRCTAGLIHIPVSGVTYAAWTGGGAFRIGPQRERIRLNSSGATEAIRILLSRDDPSPEVTTFMQTIGNAQAMRLSSSLKFCLLAEGSAEFYPRQVGSMEWDIAPGSILLEETGGLMCYFDGSVVTYNRPNLLNPPFVAMSASFINRFPNWLDLLAPFRK